MDINYATLVIFAPALILVGLAGSIIPKDKALTSGAPAYSLFHIVSGVLGLMILVLYPDWSRAFNITFGVIDLYQAVASWANLFPKRYFKWTTADDVLHIVVGAALVAIGLMA